MALDLTPVTWLGAGYVSDSSAHVIKFNTNVAATNKLLAQLSDSQADSATGDIRRVVYGILDALYTAWLAQPTSNQPNRMSISRGINPDSSGNLQYTYSVNILVTPPSGQYVIPSET